MIEFRLATDTKGQPIVEVWRDDLFVAGIYGAQGGVRLVSKYLDGVVYDTGFPPAVLIKLSGKEVKGKSSALIEQRTRKKQ